MQFNWLIVNLQMRNLVKKSTLPDKRIQPGSQTSKRNDEIQ